MSDNPSFTEAVSHPSYDAAATGVSKTYIFLFFAFCAVVAYLDSPPLGLWWVAVLTVGMFAASILFALPVTALKLFLATKVGISPLSAGGKALYMLIGLGSYVLMWYCTRYALNALA
jgi:hypothetical protein